jgi:hypothetical protein
LLKLPVNSYTDYFDLNHLNMASTTSASDSKITRESLEAALAAIPSHPALKSSSQTLSITLDFTSHPHDFWTGPAFIPYRTTLEEILPLYRLISRKIFVAITFPHYRTQSIALKQTQRDLVNRVAGLVGTFDVESVEVVFMSPETNWLQVQALAPFWGLKGKWICRVKEGERRAYQVMGGDELEGRLRGLYRCMRERKELY